MDMGDGSGDFRASMARHSFVRIAFIAAVAAIAVVLVFLSLTVGTRDLSMGEVFRLFIDHLSGVTYDRDIQHDLWYDDNIVWNYRLPRALFAIIAGAGLAVAGAAMQSVMKNPLADPYTTGISSNVFASAWAVGVAMPTTISQPSSLKSFAIDAAVLISPFAFCVSNTTSMPASAR